MNIRFTGRHMEMTEALKSYIENALSKLETHLERGLDADVILDVEKHRHIAEINLNANGVKVYSKESSADMYASVDAVINKLETQVKKYKGRINRHQPRKSAQGRDYHHAIISMGGDNGNELEELAVRHQVVQRQKLPMTPLNVEEAVMQLELGSEYPFLVFSNAETSQVNVLYSREDGTYGLIEPEF